MKMKKQNSKMSNLLGKIYRGTKSCFFGKINRIVKLYCSFVENEDEQSKRMRQSERMRECTQNEK